MTVVITNDCYAKTKIKSKKKQTKHRSSHVHKIKKPISSNTATDLTSTSQTASSAFTPITSDHCSTPYINQILALRDAQLNIVAPETKRTLAILKNEHDKNVAKLIMLKGLQQIRTDYLTANGKKTIDIDKDLSKIEDLDNFLEKENGDLNSTEKMLLLEKSIRLVSGVSTAKTKEEFYTQLSNSCQSPKTSDDKPDEASINLCDAFNNPHNKEMIEGFYSVYLKGDPTKEELEQYLKFLHLAADEKKLNTQLSAHKKLISEVNKTASLYKNCTVKKVKACSLSSSAMTQAYSDYKKTIDEQFSDKYNGKTSVILDQRSKEIDENMAEVDQSINNLKSFLKYKNSKKKKSSTLFGNKTNYQKIINDLDEFGKKNKHDKDDFSALLKQINCKSTLFKDRRFGPQNKKNFASCVRNISDESLKQQIDQLNIEIEKDRVEIGSITNAPLISATDQKKETYRKYLDFSTAINEILSIMESKCKLTDITQTESYQLQVCRINEISPPEEAKNLNSQIEKVLNNLQISSASDKDALPGICERLKNYGQIPPPTLCNREPEEKVPPKTASPTTPLLPPPPVPPQSNLNQNTVNDTETNTTTDQATALNENSDEKSSSAPNSARASRLPPRDNSQTGSVDYFKAFANAFGSSTQVQSALGLFAQSFSFQGQLDLQVLYAKNQIYAETYQNEWLKYYNQSQAASWANFNNSSQGLPIYNGGLYYNFTSN